MFEVKVADVQGRERRQARPSASVSVSAARQDFKKAYVRLAPGQSIDLTGPKAKRRKE